LLECNKKTDASKNMHIGPYCHQLSPGDNQSMLFKESWWDFMDE